jgi:hypothetical protein
MKYRLVHWPSEMGVCHAHRSTLPYFSLRKISGLRYYPRMESAIAVKIVVFLTLLAAVALYSYLYR